MSVTAVAAAGTALALWLYSRRQNDLELEEREVATHRGAHKAPQTFVEDLYYFAEGLRCEPGKLGAGVPRARPPAPCAPA